MKKILLQLFIIALFFIPFVSSAGIVSVSTTGAITKPTSATLTGTVSQFNFSFINPTPPKIFAGFKYSKQYTNNCANMEPVGSTLPFDGIIPKQEGQVLFDIFTPQTVDGPIEVTKDIAGLTAGTTYYFCIYATEEAPISTNEIFYSSVDSFKTAPTVTLTATPNVIPSGGNTLLTWTTEGAVSCSATGGWSGAKTASGGSQNISDVRVKTVFTLTCNNGFNYGNTVSNVTVNISATATTTNIGKVITVPLPGGTEPEEILKVTDTTALLQGKVLNIADLGASNKPNYGYFRISKVSIPPIFCNDIFGSNMISAISTAPSKKGEVIAGTIFSTTITKLEPDTEYAYCAIVSNHATAPSEISYGQVVNFRTNPCVTCPHTTIRTLNPANIGTNSAILQGSYNSTRHIKTWFEYKDKGFGQEKVPTPVLDTVFIPKTGKTFAIANIIGSSILETVKIGGDIIKTQINISKVGAAVPEWKKTVPEDHLSVRNYGRMSYTLTGLEKNRVYQYRAVGQTIKDTTRPNPNPIQTFYGNTIEFKTLIYGDNQDVLAHCYNGVKDFGETAVDEGGGCPTKAPNCYDGIKNGNETSIDEGGTCGTPNHCYNGVQDFGETSIDSGGPCGTTPPDTCPPGTTGTPGNCITALTCGDGYTGTPPDCIPIGNDCPFGYSGTYPDCVPDDNDDPTDDPIDPYDPEVLCPYGQTGTPPNCKPIKEVSVTMTASPNYVVKGGNITLTWNSTNATSCLASGPAIGGSTQLNNAVGIPNITKNSSWSVSCVGEGGSASDSAFVGVYTEDNNGNDLCPIGQTGTPPNCKPIKEVSVTMTASPNYVVKGGNITLTWNSTNATSCLASGPAIGGSTQLNNAVGIPNITKNSSWSVSCVGEGGSASDSAFVGVYIEDNTNNPECPYGYTGKYPNCVGPTECPPNTVGIFPNCKIIKEECEKGTTGTWPNCKYPPCPTGDKCDCPTGSAGTYPNCTFEPIDECPFGTTGKYPNCKFIPECPVGYSGTYPDCKKDIDLPDHCTNGLQDFGETGIDTGGSCGEGGLPWHCYNGIKDQNETGIDTGGSCSDGPYLPSHCYNGIKDADETGIDTGGSCGTGIGYPPHCYNGVKDGNETGVDVGGSCAYDPGVPPHCFNGIRDSDETGVDVGGSCGDGLGYPAHCYNGVKDADETGIDVGGSCSYDPNNPNGPDLPSHCYNGIKDQNETGIDTGGSCGNGIGYPPHCYNGVKDGNETGIDVGGSCAYDPGLPSHCYNGIKDQNETGIDTGGSCGTGIGYPPHCYNGVKDGNETGIDVGGSCSYDPTPEPSCPPGFTGNPPTCVGITTCPLGTAGKWPDCTFVPPTVCPAGTIGKFPDCKTTTGTCPAPFVFLAPDICTLPTQCPTGGYLLSGNYQGSGSYLSNVNDYTEKEIKDIKSYTETTSGTNKWPDCSVSVPTTCPPGYTGNFPICTSSSTTPISHCSNGIQDFGETSIDRGAGCGGVYPDNPTCFDNIRNGGETGIDKGGHCGDGPDNDDGKYPSCFDNIKNGSETSIDKGGHCGGDNNGTDWIDGYVVPDITGTGTVNGTCLNGNCSGNVNFNYPNYTGNYDGTWNIGGDSLGPINLNCTNGICTGTFTGTIPGLNGPFLGTLTGGNGIGDNSGIDWINTTFPGFSGTGNINGNCTNGICTGTWTGVVPGQDGPMVGIWSGPEGTGPFIGTCNDGVCSGTWTGVVPGNNGPLIGIWTGGNGNGNPENNNNNNNDNNNWVNVSFNGTEGTGTFNGNCTGSGCSGNWTGIVPGENGPISGNWTGPNGTGTYTGTCKDGVCTGTWTGGTGDVGPINGTWNGSNGNNPAVMTFDNNGTGTFSGNCTGSGCSGNWTGIVPGENGPISGNWTGPNGTGTYTGTCKDGVCTGTWTGGTGDVGPINGTWNGDKDDSKSTDLTYNGINGTGTFEGTCKDGKCSGNWTGIVPGENGPISGNWTGPNGTGTYTGTCKDGVCTGTWTGTSTNPTNGPISGNWNGSENTKKDDFTNLTYNGIDGNGTFSGTCKDGKCSGNWTGIVPGHDGPISGTFSNPDGTKGTFTGTCKDGVCTGTWTGTSTNPKNGPINGTWNGSNGNNPAKMVFNGVDGVGTFNGTCTKDGCSGEWTGLIPGHNGPISGKWKGPNGEGTFTGNCVNGVCTGTWVGGKGDIGKIYGTWAGSNGKGNNNELYLGYEGTPDVDDIVRYHEGVEHVFIRRIMINTELARKYGYKKGDNLLYFAWDLAHKFAQEFGYVDKNGKEIRVNLPDVSAYQLKQVGNKLTVYEYYKNKIIDIRDTTTVFKNKNSYEYYFQKD